MFDEDHEAFRAMVRSFVAKEIEPGLPAWERTGVVDRELYAKAGKAGILGIDVAEEFGGGGIHDFRFNLVVIEELCRAGAVSLTMNFSGFNDLVAPYLNELATPGQKRRWLPGLCTGKTVAAIAMTEPEAGSDLKAMRTTAVRDGDIYIVNGAKTFISNGLLADTVITVVSTDPAAGRDGLSLLVLERGMPGFERGRKLDKLGLRAQDTAELSFTDVRVPAGNLLGKEGHGFGYLMQNLPQERLSVAAAAVACMERTFSGTLAHVREREAFGRKVADFQAVRFDLAELATEIQAARVFLDRCVEELVAGRLTGADAAMVKLWTTELQQTVVQRCLQLHGGYGYIREYDVARDFLDARASTIYAGTSQIMKEVIGRSLWGR
ncbi:alkylation response protein AidB-like acyl-CoA dehydrogenase [Amycolatopsis endophytica]|uniref:Alkylation response protein AidB-like acyl-CoA dehydrogenase n=1 Tax=Amycolatopsis endophytica TaxID=860233 RepID=A0A853BA41_9PSEU|nr:alkylation response protein AidB-like acyl-CoA dehydrogenase [Amycolatopsis endophytica]